MISLRSRSKSPFHRQCRAGCGTHICELLGELLNEEGGGDDSCQVQHHHNGLKAHTIPLSAHGSGFRHLLLTPASCNASSNFVSSIHQGHTLECHMGFRCAPGFRHTHHSKSALNSGIQSCFCYSDHATPPSTSQVRLIKTATRSPVR